MNRFVLLIATIAISAVLGGCSNNSVSADPPTDFSATPGDSAVTLTWTAAPDVEYWLFYATGSTVTSSNWADIGGKAVINAKSPYTITGLANNSTYSFTMNARKGGGPGGSGAPTQVVVPRFAGSKWTVGTSLGIGTLNGIAAASTINVIVGTGGVVFAGTNGTVATSRTNPAVPANLNAVAHGGQGFVAVGAAGTVIFSSDATTWTTKVSGTIAELLAVTSPGTGAFMAVGAGGTTIFSVDATTWTTKTSGTTQNLNAVTFGSGRYVAVGAAGTIVTSVDGTTWQTVVSNTTNDLRAVALGTFTTVTGTGSTATTTVNNIFVAMGAAGTVLTSGDAITWVSRATISANTINALAFGGQFVAVGNAGSIFTSTDGVTWEAQLSGTSNNLTSLARTAVGYTAVGVAGTVLTSF